MGSRFEAETVLTFFFLFIILGSTDECAPKGFAPIALTGPHPHPPHPHPRHQSVRHPARNSPRAVRPRMGLLELWLFWLAPALGASLPDSSTVSSSSAAVPEVHAAAAKPADEPLPDTSAGDYRWVRPLPHRAQPPPAALRHPPRVAWDTASGTAGSLKQIAETHRPLTRDRLATPSTPSSPRSPTPPRTPTDLEIATLLTAMATRGETVEELTGFVEATRALCCPSLSLPLSVPRSSRRAEPAATASAPSTSPPTHSAAAAGAKSPSTAIATSPQNADPPTSSKPWGPRRRHSTAIPHRLRATVFTFLFAPALHPVMKCVQPVRRALGFRTISTRRSAHQSGPRPRPCHGRLRARSGCRAGPWLPRRWGAWRARRRP